MKDFIKKKLNEQLMGEDYPLDFNMDNFKTIKSFNDRIKYCQNTLKRIASGSSRIVYKIDDTKVLKLAKNRKGLAQNNVEIDWGRIPSYEDILAHTFDFDNNSMWVEMELARKVKLEDFDKLLGFSLEELSLFYHSFIMIGLRLILIKPVCINECLITM